MDTLLDAAELAKRYGVSTQTIARHVPAVKLGRRRLYRPEDVERALRPAPPHSSLTAAPTYEFNRSMGEPEDEASS